MDKKKIIEKIRDDNFSLYHQEYLEWLSSPHTTPVDFNKDWVGTDCKKEFDKNLKKYSKWLQPFVNNPIRYNINKQNFRSKFDFKPDKDLDVDLYLGCSHTFGVGMYEEYIWPKLVSKATGNTMINLGCSGHGISMSYINLKKYIDYYNVKNVFCYQPFYGRYQVRNNGKFDMFSFDTPAHLHKIFHPFYVKDELSGYGSITNDVIKHVEAIEGVCRRKGVNFYYLCRWPEFQYTIFHFEDGTYMKDDIPARDLIHHSKHMYQELADRFINVYNKTDYYVGFKLDK